jgi:hypothetical protein
VEKWNTNQPVFSYSIASATLNMLRLNSYMTHVVWDEYFRYQFLVAFTVNGTVFWIVTACSSVRSSVRTYRLHLQARRIIHARDEQRQVVVCSSFGFLVGLLFDSEDGGDMPLSGLYGATIQNTILFNGYFGPQPIKEVHTFLSLKLSTSSQG